MSRKVASVILSRLKMFSLPSSSLIDRNGVSTPGSWKHNYTTVTIKFNHFTLYYNPRVSSYFITRTNPLILYLKFSCDDLNCLLCKVSDSNIRCTVVLRLRRHGARGIRRLIDWLFNGTSTQAHQICLHILKTIFLVFVKKIYATRCQYR
jgi:hypothetical protein